MLQIKTQTRKIKFWVNLLLAYFKRYKNRLFFGAGAIAILIFSLVKIWPDVTKSNILTIGYVGSYTLENIPSMPLGLVTQPLITHDRLGNPVPALASHWQIIDEGRTYLVFLKDNLKWHDGTTLEASDITIAASGINITAINSKTLQFQLPSPVTSFHQALDKPVFKKNTFYGTGDYRIVDIDKVQDTVKKISLVPQSKELPPVEIKFYTNETQAEQALKIGEVKTVQVSAAGEFSNWPNLSVEKQTTGNEIVTLFFNTQDNILGAKEMRQALIHATNRNDFDGEIATSPVANTSWAFNTNLKRYDYNTGRAKELLTKAGYTNQKITITTTSDLKQLAESIQKDWQAIGVQTEISIAKNIPAEFQVLLAVNKLSPDPDQYSLWHSTQAKTNITHYKNVKVDKLLEDGRTTQDQDQRRELYEEFQKTLVEDAPAAFLYHPYKYQIIYKNAQPLINQLPTPGVE